MTTNFSTSYIPSLVHSYIPPSLQPFITLSYAIIPTRHFSFLKSHGHGHSYSQPILYEKGPKDIYFVAFCAVGFTVLRQVMMTCVFQPFAGWELEREARLKGGGEAGKRASKRERRRRDHIILRFSEQSWSCFYCTVSWILGLVRISHPPLISHPL